MRSIYETWVSIFLAKFYSSIKSSVLSLNSFEFDVYLMMSSSPITCYKMLMLRIFDLPFLPPVARRLGDSSQDLNLPIGPLVLGFAVVLGVGFEYFLREGPSVPSRCVTTFEELIVRLSAKVEEISLNLFFNLLGEGLSEVSCERCETAIFCLSGISMLTLTIRLFLLRALLG
jgi:hypothetical protein